MYCLLPYHISNMLDYGEYEGKSYILFDLLGVDFKQLIKAGIGGSPQHYESVCLWAKQMVTIAD